MYVRWKRRARKQRHSHDAPPQLLTAVLVESHRIDGKPRQRTVAYVGSIRDNHIDLPFCLYRRDFWQRATARLDALDLPASERAAVDGALLRVVPRPCAAEIAAAEAEIGRFHETLRAIASARRR